jgi:hypothetical protein
MQKFLLLFKGGVPLTVTAKTLPQRSSAFYRQGGGGFYYSITTPSPEPDICSRED